MIASAKQNPEVSKALDPEIAEGKIFAVLGYLSILCFVPLFLKRDNKFAQFHGRQALVLFILEVAAAMLAIIPVVGELVFRLAWLIFGILSLAGIVKVLMNEYWEMPFVYRISSKITL
ncbi:MAG: hypothetical protein HY584_00235 [Candidatus Omnitrophica bacterium]|nr:hypothetical protein [Candidatus Omnitrophota bacterium]